MKKYKLQLLLFALATMLVSCDPGYSLMLSNYSDSPQKITINMAPGQDHDSLAIADTTGFFAYKTKMHEIHITGKDTIHHTYSFILENGKTALLEYGIGGPSPKQKIIVDGNDTINFRKDKRMQVRRKFMHASFLISVR